MHTQSTGSKTCVCQLKIDVTEDMFLEDLLENRYFNIKKYVIFKNQLPYRAKNKCVGQNGG